MNAPTRIYHALVVFEEGSLDLKQAILRARIGPGRAGSRGANRMPWPAGA